MSTRASLMLAILLILNLVLPGCPGSSNSQTKKPGFVIGQKPQTPASVSQFLSSLEKIIADVEDKYKNSNKTSSRVRNATSVSEEDSGQDQTGDKQSEKKKTASIKSQSGSERDQWRREDQTLKDLHKTWNMLEPDSVKAGIAVSKRTRVEEGLEKLTMAIARRDPGTALESSIELYGAFADIVEVFAYRIPADYFRTRYEAMATTFKASQSQWAPAGEHVTRLREYWDLLKAQAQGADPNIISRTDFSVHDLEEAVKKQQIELVMLKSEILMNNLKNLKNEFVLRQQS